eukprot:Em0013g247a
MSTYMTLLPRRVQSGAKADNVVVSTLEMRPSDRTEQDIEIITSKLKKLNVLQQLPENVIEEIGRHATTKSFAANRPVIVPDATVTHLYIILTGSVAVTVIDLNDPSKFVSLCTLTTGCSFGETCVFGQQHYKDVMVTTCEDTDVMCVEGELMKKLFTSHGSELDRSLLASNPSADDGPAVSEAIRALWQMICFHFGDHLREHPVGTVVYPACSSGRELVDWLLSYQRSPLWTRQQITMIGQVLLNEGFLKQVLGEPVFQDASNTHYQYLIGTPTSPQGPMFPPPLFSPSSRRHSFLFPEQQYPGDPDPPSPISPESLPTLLDQCINTILQHSSDVLVTNASLRKSSFHRTKGDLDLIVEDMKYMKGFMYLQESAQEKLAKYVYLQNYPRAASYICRQGDDVECWYTIIKGSVNVLRDEEVVCTLHLYDNFGKEMIENDMKWPATFQLRQNFGIVLCVDKKNLLEINSELKANTITEDGWEVVMEKKVSPDQKRRTNSLEAQDSADSATIARRTLQRTKSRVTLRGRLCSVKKASPNKIVDRLVQSDVDQGDVTAIFAEDFFLTYLSYMTTDELCSKLLDKYIASDGLLMGGRGEGGEGERTDGAKYLSVPGGEPVTVSNGHGPIDSTSRKRNIAKHVAMWIEVGGSLLLGDSSFKQFLAQLQQRLAKDELLSEQETLRRAVTMATQANSAWLETASRLEAARPDTPSRDPHHYLVVESPVHKQSPLGSPRQSPMASPIMRRSLQSPPVGESPTMRRRENFMQTMRIALRGRSEDSVPLSLGFSMFPPFSPHDKDEVVVHLNRKESVSLSLQMEDTARVILNKACHHFKLDPSRHDLCELDSAGVKVVMKLQTASVHTKLSVKRSPVCVPN